MRSDSSIRREFLGWDRPALQEAAQRLTTRYRKGQELDLGRVIVVVPGQRAGRRLQELLALAAENEKLALTPPHVVTEGRLPEMLYTPKLPFANDIIQDLAWAEVLRRLPQEQRQHLLPNPPAPEDRPRWLELGKVLRRLHVEMAADGLDFSAVRQIGPKLTDFREADRWQALIQLQIDYLALLDRQQLWDIQTARLKAIEFQNRLHEIDTDCDIILLGAVDLNKTLRQMLDQVADRVTVYIVAPESLADRFDAHGCLIASAWRDVEIPLRDEQLCQVEGPTEQAEAVSRWLGELGDRFRRDEVVIGVPDEALVPHLQRELNQCDMPARWVQGVRLRDTAPYRLLTAAVQFACRRRYEDLAALLRHPDVEDWLAPMRMSSAAQLDQFYNACLPSRITSGRALANSEQWPDLRSAIERLDAWLEGASVKHPLREWPAVFRELLSAVYGGRTCVIGATLPEALHRILDSCDRLASIPETLDGAAFAGTDALPLALAPLADDALPPPADPEAVEILGWLELPLDDAGAVAITTFNEGFVPKCTGAEVFLPDRLRRELDLLHNERRYARDAYATCVLCHARPELRLIFARRDTNKEPLQPSRLLFACPEEVMVARARRFFDRPTAPVGPRRLLLAGKHEPPSRSRFQVPRPVFKGTQPRIPVTHFKEYLACPYRYYLRKVEKLQAIEDAERELAGDVFGSLLHAVLGAFGRDAAGPRHSGREQDIFDYLVEQLRMQAENRIGVRDRRPAIRLQLEQTRLRLRAFAARQAEMVRDGWRILYAEEEEVNPFEAFFPLQQNLIKIVGRIDRIDFHEGKRRVRIVDYKTADKAVNPDQSHFDKKRGWIDLQLPLYRHLWPRQELDLPPDTALELGYFNLPKCVDETAFAAATWDANALADADRRAEEIARKLHASDAAAYEEIARPPPKYCEDLAAICLDNWESGPALSERDEGEAE